MVQFLSIIFFFLGFLQFLLGFSKVPVFLCHPVQDLGEDCIMRSLIICSAHQVCKANEVGGTYSTHGSD